LGARGNRRYDGERVNLTLPFRSPIRLKTQRIVLGRLSSSPERWWKRGNWSALLKWQKRLMTLLRAFKPLQPS